MFDSIAHVFVFPYSIHTCFEAGFGAAIAGGKGELVMVKSNLGPARAAAEDGGEDEGEAGEMGKYKEVRVSQRQWIWFLPPFFRCCWYIMHVSVFDTMS